MSVFFLQRYVALKVLDQVGDKGIELAPMARPFRNLAQEEFGNLSRKLFPTDSFTAFHKTFLGLADTYTYSGALIEERADKTYAINDKGKEELTRLEQEYARKARPLNGVSIVQRQDYLFLKTATERTSEDMLFVDEMNQRGQLSFGMYEHDVSCELYPWSASENKYRDNGCIEWNEDIGENGGYSITDDGLARLAELEAIVASAKISSLSSDMLIPDGM